MNPLLRSAARTMTMRSATASTPVARSCSSQQAPKKIGETMYEGVARAWECFQAQPTHRRWFVYGCFPLGVYWMMLRDLEKFDYELHKTPDWSDEHHRFINRTLMSMLVSRHGPKEPAIETPEE